MLARPSLDQLHTLVFMAWPRDSGNSNTSPKRVVLVAGTTQIGVIEKRGGTAFPGRDGALVHALHDKRDGLFAFGERKEGLRAQSPKDIGLSKSDSGLDLGLALSRQLQIVSGRLGLQFASRIPSTRLSGSRSSLSAAARTGAKTV